MTSGAEAAAATEPRDLILVGAGGFGRETAQAVYALNKAAVRWRFLGYIDDSPERHGTVVDDAVVLGGRELIGAMSGAAVTVCTGRPGDYLSRARIVRALALPRARYATVIHPSAQVSESSTIGAGSVLLANVALTAAVRVGDHVAIMPQVTLTHDDHVADFATIASGVLLGGGVRVETGAYLGAGAIIGEGRTIGAYSLVGMGSVVTHDVPPGQVWAGVPARYMRPADVPAEVISQ